MTLTDNSEWKCLEIRVLPLFNKIASGIRNQAQATLGSANGLERFPGTSGHLFLDRDVV